MTSPRKILIMAENNFQMADLLLFLTFYINLNNLTLWVRELSFSFILLKFVMQVTNIQLLKKLINDSKKMADLLRCFAFYLTYLTLWHDKFKSF